MKTSLITYAPEISNNGINKSHTIKNILDPFVTSLENPNKQNQIEVINLDKMVINECWGCSEDLFFIPKEDCRQTDDMNSIYPILRDSDLWFFAIESNSYALPKKLINFLDRLEPLFNESFDEFNFKEKSKKSDGKIFLLAISSLWDKRVFDELSLQIQSLSLLFDRKVVGQILRPHYGAFMNKFNSVSDFHNQVLNQIDDIAHSIMNSDKIKESDFHLLNSNVIDREEYLKTFSNILSIN